MNDIFKNMNSKKIILDDKYYLEPDGYHGLVLVFEEERTRKKLDPKTKKETGETEDYIFSDKWYFPKTSQTLDKYLTLSLKENKTVEELRNTLERVEKTIESIKENWN